MKTARKPSRPPSRRPPSEARGRRAEAREAAAGRPLAVSLGRLFVWLVILVPPFLVSVGAKEAFRLPKLMASEWLALASLLFLSWRAREVDEVKPADLWRRPAVRAVLPFLLVAAAGLLVSRHPLHVQEALVDLGIGAAVLVGWSLALETRWQERVLRGLLLPASALALLGILQFHRIFQPLAFAGIEYDPRLSVTSLAGNPGDLGAYLVLPCLIGQWAVARSAGRPRWPAAAALAVCLYAMAVTQTLAALAALVAGSLLLWALLLPRRRAALLLGGGAVAAVLLVLAVPPLRGRVMAKAGQALSGDWNSVLTGRLDGWTAAVWMFRQHPWAGVGHGAYRPEFIPAKLALLDRGTEFYEEQLLPVFANAHNEYLEVAAEMGVPGLLALGWGLWVLLLGLRRGRGEEPGGGRPLAWAGVAALAVLSLAHFPFHIALISYPALLFLSWVFRRGTGEEEPA